MLRTDEGLPLKYILPESRPLLEQYRELGLADISPGTEAHPERPRPPARGRHRGGTVLNGIIFLT
ncbi:hypothetical protein M5E88_19575 [Akkermansia muciniphila]|nr:hypothetical protein M5E88_19575 [Akkermansia muciniphila]